LKDLKRLLISNLEARLGPRLLIELFAEIASERTSAYQLCKRYRISLMDVRVLRQFPQWTVEYIIGRLRKRAKKPAVVLQFQKRA